MKTILAVVVMALMVSPAVGDYYLAGDFNGWNAAGNIMIDMGGGVWKADLAGLTAGRHEFKVTQGDWGWNVPGSGNSWMIVDASGAVSVSVDTNTYADGWRGDTNRIGVSTEPGAWTAVGDWQGWSNSDPATAMAAIGGGVYFLEKTLAPGTYQWKAVNTGTWDAIGNDARSINADTAWFDVTAANPTARFSVNALKGTIKVSVVPEPAGLLALASGLAGLGGMLLRRKQTDIGREGALPWKHS